LLLTIEKGSHQIIYVWHRERSREEGKTDENKMKKNAVVLH